MKTIDELGISPWPWIITDQAGIISKYGEVISGQYGPYNWNNARLIAAAPEMYEVLRDAVIAYCTFCHYDICDDNNVCKVKKWREVLAKASGESEVGK